MGLVTSAMATDAMESQYEYLLSQVSDAVSSYFQCKLCDVTLLKTPLNVLAPGGPGNDLTLHESQQLTRLIEENAYTLHDILCAHFYSAYPVICDVAADITARLLATKMSDLFDTYLTIGGYGETGPGTYHAWITVRGRYSGALAYVDLTYLQFLREYRAASTFVGPTGAVITRESFDVFREKVYTSFPDIVFPKAVILPSSVDWFDWLPHQVARVVLK